MSLDARLRQLESKVKPFNTVPKRLFRSPDLRDMSDDQLAQVINSDSNAKSCDITDEQLKALIQDANQRH